MTRSFIFALPIVLATASTCAFASTHLTAHQCNSYPFIKPASGDITRADMNRELAELEAMGYRPSLDNYSLDISQARAQLKAEYRKDCAPNRPTASVPSTNG